MSFACFAFEHISHRKEAVKVLSRFHFIAVLRRNINNGHTYLNDQQ